MTAALHSHTVCKVDDENRVTRRDTAADALLAHPVRAALLELLRTRPTLTSADAARELGGNTGLYSFHLRRLARYGLIEEAPGVRGRVRPWRLATPRPEPSAEAGPDLGDIARGLEDESYQRWLDRRDQAPARWWRDEAFSQVVYLTPRELTALGGAVRELIAEYRDRESRPATRPPGAEPVAVVARLFPLLDADDR